MRGVVRYLSGNPKKDITAPEAQSILGAGMWLWLVWELRANRAGEGRAAGVADAVAAEAQADSIGYPDSASICYAVDYDATPEAVASYFAGVKSVAKREVGIYGSARIIDANLAPHGWQTEAWSKDPKTGLRRVSARAKMLQRVTRSVTIAGSKDTDWDENLIIPGPTIPVWNPGEKAKPLPATSTPKQTLKIATYNAERDRPTGAVIAELKTLTRGRDVVMLQEANDYGDALAKPDAIPGYTYVGFTLAREQNETAILVRDTLRLANAGVEKRTTAGWTTVKGGKTPPKWSSKVTVEGVEFSSEHLAPSQQPATKRLLMPARARSYDEHMRNIPGGGKCVRAGDFNVTPSATNVATYPAVALPKKGLTIAAPKTGTHGSRVIDYLAVAGVVVTSIGVVPGTWGSDHKPVEATIEF